jgi:hypothetical protein
LRKVERSGRDDSVGSLDNWKYIIRNKYGTHVVKGADQLLHGLHDPFSTAFVGPIANDPDLSELGANTKDWSLAGYARGIFFLPKLRRE